MAEADWRAELDQFLKPFVAHPSHRARRAMCPLYIAGLIDPGVRKCVRPMAARPGLCSHDALHHFVSAGRAEAEPLGAELLAQADRLVGGLDAVLIADDTALSKKGIASVGVALSTPTWLGQERQRSAAGVSPSSSAPTSAQPCWLTPPWPEFGNPLPLP